MKAIKSESTLWLPDYFNVPPPDVIGDIELIRTERACMDRCRRLDRGSDEHKLFDEQRLAAQRTFGQRMEAIIEVRKAIPAERVQAIASPLLKALVAYGEENPNPNGSTFYNVHIQSRTDKGLYITTELTAQKHPVTIKHPDAEDEHIEDFYSFDEAVSIRDRRIADSNMPHAQWPHNQVVRFKMYPATDTYPVIDDMGYERPDAPFEGGISTNGPFFWGSYPDASPRPLMINLDSERVDDMQRFAEQFAEIAIQQPEEAA